MKHLSEEDMRRHYLMAGVSDEEVLERLKYCIEQIGLSKKVSMDDAVVPDKPDPETPMTFEELTGALLGAEGVVKEALRLQALAQAAEEDM